MISDRSNMGLECFFDDTSRRRFLIEGSNEYKTFCNVLKNNTKKDTIEMGVFRDLKINNISILSLSKINSVIDIHYEGSKIEFDNLLKTNG